jgi:hypothetical protein
MCWLFISWQPYSIGQGVDGALNVMVLIGGVEEQATDYLCEISSSHGGEYDVQSRLLGYTAV